MPEGSTSSCLRAFPPKDSQKERRSKETRRVFDRLADRGGRAIWSDQPSAADIASHFARPKREAHPLLLPAHPLPNLESLGAQGVEDVDDEFVVTENPWRHFVLGAQSPALGNGGTRILLRSP